MNNVRSMFATGVLLGFSLGMIPGLVASTHQRREMEDTIQRIQKNVDQARREANEVRDQCTQDFIRAYGERAK